jgi:hypothetical protein
MLPPVPDEHVRLWRGIAAVPDGGDVGEFFTLYRDDAEDYSRYDLDQQRVNVSTLFVLDVPIAVAFAWGDHSGRTGRDRACGEFIVPREWANRATVVPKP